MLFPIIMSAQNASDLFFTISEKRPIAVLQEVSSDTIYQTRNLSLSVDSAVITASEASVLSITPTKIELLINLYKKWRNKGEVERGIVNKSRILSYYDGTSKELTLSNILEVMKEVGLSNRLIVLAQAVLETGNFSSKVCKQYNNLFGLYDSRHHDYYRFEKWEDSVVAYQKFIQYRYKGGNYFQFLKRIGYAEDRQYISKVAKIAKQLYNRLIESETK